MNDLIRRLVRELFGVRYRNGAAHARRRRLASIEILEPRQLLTTFFDDLSAANGGSYAVSDATYEAGQFTTDSSTYNNLTVSLLMSQTTAGTAQLDLYTNSGIQPGTLIATFTPPASFSSSLANATFTLSGLSLTASTDYWIVLHAPTGAYNWGWTSDFTVTQPWGESTDSGSIWFTDDAFPFQYSVVGSTGTTTPSLSINDVTVAEGDSGQTAVSITVTLSAASSQTVSITFAAADSTAVATSDYASSSGTLTFAPGDTTKTGTVQIQGDLLNEGNEAFFVNLSNAINATISDGQGTVTITDDDVPHTADLTRLRRAYNPVADFHFFTTSQSQFDNAVANGYRDETTGQAGFSILNRVIGRSTAVYRLYNLAVGFHYYTTNAQERDALVALAPPPASGPDTRTVGWRDESSEGFLYATQESNTTEVYHLYNVNSGSHMFTESNQYRAQVLAMYPDSWVQHTSLGFAFASLANGQNPGVAAARTGSIRMAAATLAVEESGGQPTPTDSFAMGLVSASRNGSLLSGRLATSGVSSPANPMRSLSASDRDLSNMRMKIQSPGTALGSPETIDAVWKAFGSKVTCGLTDLWGSD
ncbi:MAG: hypothetical protein HZA46_13220 [Planctomycetales bacterium]|nr:hypothetical protein [Planctomycetales bacterium]